MLTDFALVILALSTLVGLWALNSNRRSPLRKLPYPPGPAPKGFISGNKSDISAPYVWRRYNEWAKEYGNILHLRIFGRHIIILNSFEDSVGLLERRSKIYSSRPVVPMYDLMGFGNSATGMRVYGPEWRKHRKIFQQSFKPDSSIAHRPIQTRKMHDMLCSLLDTPEDFQGHIKTYAAAIILSVIYGYDVVPKNDPFVNLLESLLEAFSVGPSPKWLVNGFPVLRHIPLWFPGAGFKRYATYVKRRLMEQREIPFKYATTSPLVLEGTHTSVVTSLLSGCHSEMDVALLKEAAGSGYGAGVATTVSSILVFLVAMITYPEIQRKAQVEIDRVTGGQRLPEYRDQSSLPYVQAIVREVIRWKPVAPLGLSHANNEDDIYKGYYIPKGSIIYPNIWAMTRDPAKYKDPEAFNPDRFFNEKGELNDDDVNYAFGFGRRICPGRHLGVASIWLAVAAMLSSFNIEHKKDANGQDIPLEVSYTGAGVTSSPVGLKCSITPRSEKARQIILAHRGEV